MSEVQDEAKFTVQLSVVGFVLTSVSERMYSTAGCKYGDCMCWDCVTGVMQLSTAFCVWDFHNLSTV